MKRGIGENGRKYGGPIDYDLPQVPSRDQSSLFITSLTHFNRIPIPVGM